MFLTEKLKDGSLKKGEYYVIAKSGEITQAFYKGKGKSMYDAEGVRIGIKEVIDHVPTYEQYDEIVLRASCPSNPLAGIAVIGDLLKQIYDANRVVREIAFGDSFHAGAMAENYLDKWDLK